MNKPIATLFALILFSFPNISTANINQIDFLEVPFEEIKANAKQAKKQFFTYFYGEWCLGCQVMTETTFHDQRLIEYVNENFIASKVDIESPLGKKWDEKFSINSMPTFLIFDENGNLIERYETTFSGSNLLAVLMQNQWREKSPL